MIVHFTVNGSPVEADAPPETPLLWVLREHLKLPGTRFGCGAGLCGACMVHIDGDRAFSCQTQLSGLETLTIRPDSNFITQLIANAEHPHQASRLRRTSSDDARMAYGSKRPLGSVSARTRQVA